jgi:hypothetical protein
VKFTRQRLLSTLVLAIAMILGALNAPFANATEQEEKIIKARAAEIAAFLDDTTGAIAAPREYWDRYANAPNAPNIIKYASDVIKSDPPEITEDLYKEYYRNGNRSRYQNAFSGLERRFIFTTLAEALENEGRFINALNVELDRFCDLKSWVLPAHDRNNGEIYDGKAIYSDLGSTLAAANVAIAINLFGDKLDPKVVEKAKAEIERRILQPYEKAVREAYSGMWWVRTVNNWNAVCHACTVVAALNIVESKERRAFFLAGAEYFSENYFYKGFTDDGYCSEGMGYWDYGYGNYIYLGAAARNATQGKLDFFRFPKTRAILDFAPTLEIDRGAYAVFADCGLNAKPDPLFVGYLSRLKGYGYTDFEKDLDTRALGPGLPLDALLRMTTIGFDGEVVFSEQTTDAKKYTPPIRTEFADAGVLICRPAEDAKGDYFAIALKGGHNNELHNHNDVGSYTLIRNTNADPNAEPVFVSRDPGGETYTARTFSNRRYEGELLNSFGHPVPRIADKLQSPGGRSRGVVTNKSFTDDEDLVTFDITSAYPDAEALEKAERTFLYRRASGDDPGFVTITDAIAFKEGEEGAIETAIITQEKEIDVDSTSAGGLTLRFAGVVLSVEAKDASGKALPLTTDRAIVGENDDNARFKPTRIALRVDGDVNNATIVQRFSVEGTETR